MASGRDNMTGSQEYVGRQNAADALAKRTIRAVAQAGMKQEPSYSAQPRFTSKGA